MKATRVVQTEGADIVYDIEGSGPLILLVVGGNGNSEMFAGLSKHLSDRYTVAKFDRRANARSSGDANADLDMAQQARDGAAVIQATGLGPAYVFGNSGGANIALKLTQDHPQLVCGLIDHEPPITDFLPQPAADQWREVFKRVSALYDSEGTGPAMRLFASTWVGFNPDESVPGDQAGGDHERFLAHEFTHLNSFVPDLQLLRDSGIPIVMALGRDSGNAFYAETARELAKQLPAPLVEVVGNHLGYRFHPKTFADEVHRIIEGMNVGNR